MPVKTCEKVLGLYQERYFDLSVRHFHEKLKEEHLIELSYTWVKKASAARGRVSAAAETARTASPAAGA